MLAASGSGVIRCKNKALVKTHTYELRKSLICDLSLSPVRMLTRSLPNLRAFVSAFRRYVARTKRPFVKLGLPVLHRRDESSGVD